MAHSNEIWLADLLRACVDLAPDDAALGEICRQLSMDGRLPLVRQAGADASLERAREDEAVLTQREPPPQVPPAPPAAVPPSGLAGRIFSELEFHPAEDAAAQVPAWFHATTALQAEPSPPPRLPEPLLSRLQRRAILATALGVAVPEGGLDIDRIVRTLSQGRPLLELPRLRRRTLRYGVDVWMDRAPWLEPFQGDQHSLVRYLKTLFPSDRVSVRRCRGTPVEIVPRRRKSSEQRPDPQAAVLVLSDLGAGYRPLDAPPPVRGQWRRFARRQLREQRAALALLPVSGSSLAGPLVGLGVLHWGERTTVGDAMRARNRDGATGAVRAGAEPSDEASIRMLALALSPAVRIDPWLLRAARRRFLPRHGPELEAELWFGPWVASRSAEGIVLEGEVLAGLRGSLRDANSALRAAAVALVEAAHEAYPPALRLEEALIRLELEGRLDDDAVAQALRPALKALAGEAQPASAADAQPETNADDIASWAAHAWRRFSPALRATAAARQLAFAAAARLQGAGWMRAADEVTTPDVPHDLAWLLRSRGVAQRSLMLELLRDDEGGLQLAFHEPATPTHALHPITLPDTRPLWLQLVEGEVERAVAIEPGQPIALDAAAVSAPDGVVLRTLAGDAYRVRSADAIEQVLSRSLLAVPAYDAVSESVELAAAESPNVVVLAPGLALAWPDEGREGEAIELVDAFGHRHRATRLGAVAGDDPGQPDGVSVLRVEDEDDIATRATPLALDLAARMLQPPLPQDEPGGHLGVSWHEPGRFEFVPLRAVTATLFSDPVDGQPRVSALRERGGLVMPARAGEGWMLLPPAPRSRRAAQKVSMPRASELPAWPLADLAARASTLRSERWRAYITYRRDFQGIAEDIRVGLGKQLGEWRVATDRSSIAAGDDWARSIERAVRRCDVLIAIGPRDDPDALKSEFALARQWDKRVIWVAPPSEPVKASAGPVRFGVPTAIEYELIELDSGFERDGGQLQRVIDRIAAFRLGPQPELAPASLEGEQAADTGWLSKLATGLRSRVSDQLEKRVAAPGLYHTALDRDFALSAFITPRGPAPLLIFVHSLTANTETTFGPLWQAPATTQRKALLQAYGERVFAFEHHAVSHSPIDNALQLALALPAGATLHFLTHSAGGLIGELFARAQRDDGQPAFDERDFSLFGEGVAAGARSPLQQLARVLGDKQFRIERFVRVACPARGTRIFHEAPMQAFDAMRGAMSLLSPLAGLAGSALSTVFKALQDPARTPGFAMQHPDSPLVQMLNRPDVRSRAPLTRVGGVTEAGGLMSRLVGAATTLVAFGTADNDRIVSLESSRGGVLRDGVVAEFVDRGEEVDHFSYLQNVCSREAIVAALLASDGLPPGFVAVGEGTGAPRSAA